MTLGELLKRLEEETGHPCVHIARRLAPDLVTQTEVNKTLESEPAVAPMARSLRAPKPKVAE